MSWTSARENVEEKKNPFKTFLKNRFKNPESSEIKINIAERDVKDSLRKKRKEQNMWKEVKSDRENEAPWINMQVIGEPSKGN